MQLNKQQQYAVQCVDRPCLVLAGAGSGKTGVIIQKIVYLLQVQLLSAEHVYAVTFTNKAAGEMRTRINEKLTAQQAKGLHISTFHALGFGFIKQEYKALGLKPQQTLFDEQDKFNLLQEIVNDGNNKVDSAYIYALANQISRWKNELLLPDNLSLQVTPQKQFIEFYQIYQERIRLYQVLDFDDLVLMPCLLMKKDKDVRKRWQHKIHYLLIDEYQDTNTIQYHLIKLLLGNSQGLTVVGDDDQSIYGWRGAQPENMAKLQEDFPLLEVIKLEQNYRSTRVIINAANSLIAKNKHLFPKTLFSQKAMGEKINIYEATDEENEAQIVVDKIVGHKYVNNSNYTDYAVLYRSNYQAKIIEKQLLQQKIPYKISGGISFFALSEIKDMLAYLKLIINYNDNLAFLRAVNTPKRGIGAETISKLATFATLKKQSLLQAITDIDVANHISKASLIKLNDFAKIIKKFSLDRETKPLQILEELLSTLNYETYLRSKFEKQTTVAQKYNNIQQLLQWLKIALIRDNKTFDDAVNSMLLQEYNSEEQKTGNQVNLLTLHASKGLEFPYVYLIGFEEGILPHQNSIESRTIDEERRLAYVGMTRAEKMLNISYCRQRSYMQKIMLVAKSRFLFEIDQEYLQMEAEEVLTEAQKNAKVSKNVAKILAQLKK